MNKNKWNRKKRNANQPSNVYRAIFDNSLVGIALVRMRRFVRVNHKMVDIFGYDSPDEMRGNSSRICYRSDDFFAEIGRDAYATLAEGREYRREFIGRRKDGSEFWCMLTGKAILPENAIAADSVWIFQDIDENKKYQSQLETAAFFDPLTGLPNRRILESHIKKSVANSTRSKAITAVCFIDLDDFKPVNDNYGHDVGDLVLVTVAERISAILRNSDTLSRLGGDEFVVLLDSFSEVADVHKVLAKIDKSIRCPIRLDSDKSVSIGASIGVSLFFGDSCEVGPETLLRNADRAMYVSKSLKAKNRTKPWTIYDERALVS